MDMGASDEHHSVARKLILRPLQKNCWNDFEDLFGENGAYGGCWCMWWRCTRAEFEEQHGEGNKQAMKSLVDSGVIPGLLGYYGKKAVGWISVAPRDHFGSLERSPVLRRIDESPTWSIVCLFIDKVYRGQGISLQLIRGAKEYVREQGGTLLEAYPTVLKDNKLPPVSSFMGIPSMYLRSGFVECAKPSKSKIYMRCSLEE
jgi:GNAT superfamily N-acetyltransferase